MNPSALIPVFITGIAFAVLLIWAVVVSMQIKASYTKMRNAPDWWMVIWFLAPWLAYLYFAFLHENANIPGVTEKK